MKKQILVVTNEAVLYQTLQERLNDDTSKVCGASSISESLHCLLTREYCLVILDIQFSGIDIKEMLRVIQVARNIPVLAVTDPLESAQKIDLLYAGVDAYMEKPIDPALCAAQANALIRLYLKSENELREKIPITLGPSAIISPQYRQVLVNGESLKLTRKEFDLIYYMAQHPYQVLSRRQLYEQIWNMDFALGGEDTVTTHVKTLRKKLTATGLELIETVRGLGYRYIPPVTAGQTDIP